MDNIYTITLGTHKVTYQFIFSETNYMFKNCNITPDCWKPETIYTKDIFDHYRQITPAGVKNEYVEYRSLAGPTSCKLMEYGSFLFHCVSFVYMEHAWLLSAPSGTGKTTQYLNWIRSFPDEIQMICGDMPVIEFRNSDDITVFSSPWNGKERIGNKLSAPLGGVIFLEQNQTNNISRISLADGVTRLFKQIVHKPGTEEEILLITEFANLLFSRYPVWLFKNNGQPESTTVLRNKIRAYMGASNEI